MNFKIFLIIYLQLIYTSLANLKLTSENITLPTKVKSKYVDMKRFDKLVVNDSAPLNLTFEFQAMNNILEESVNYLFFDNPIDFTKRKEIQNTSFESKGKKIFRLTFTKFTEKIAGEYTLQIIASDKTLINATGYIFSPPFLQEFQESKRSTEGGKIEVACTSFSYPLDLEELTWSEVVKREADKNYRLSKSNNSTKFSDVIVWDVLNKRDAGYYKCEARNKYGNDSVIMQLRVKDRLAPLWPFIGIVIEVIILLAVIIFYERKKSNTKTEEIEQNPTRQSLLADTKSSELNEGGLRHRNPVD